MIKQKYIFTSKSWLKLTLKALIIMATFAIIIFTGLEYYKFETVYKQDSKRIVTKTVDDILALNAQLRTTISDLLINNHELLINLSNDPENSANIEKINALFKQKLTSFYTFSLADKHGNLVTDIFFEKTGRICRQDIKQFAINKTNTWLAIHPGVGQYHYDLIVPWQYSEDKRILFISFYIDDLVSILKNNERSSHELFIVRKDKSNLIELSSSGSRANQNNIFFLTEDQLQSYSSKISGTYWTIYELPKKSIFSYYLQEVWYKRMAKAWHKFLSLFNTEK